MIITTHSFIRSNSCVLKCQSYNIVLLVTVLNCVNDAIEVNLKLNKMQWYVCDRCVIFNNLSSYDGMAACCMRCDGAWGLSDANAP